MCVCVCVCVCVCKVGGGGGSLVSLTEVWVHNQRVFYTVLFSVTVE